MKKVSQPTERYLLGTKRADSHSRRLTGEHGGAWSSYRDACFPEESVETKNRAKMSEFYYIYGTQFKG